MDIKVFDNNDGTFYIGIETAPGMVNEREWDIAKMVGMNVSDFKRTLCRRYNAKRKKNEDGEAIIYFDNQQDAQAAIDSLIAPAINGTTAKLKSRLRKNN